MKKFIARERREDNIVHGNYMTKLNVKFNI